MSKRIYELDYVRVIAVGMILVCHYLEVSGVNVGLGRYLGGSGNTVFFVVSALLYSFRFSADNQIVDVGGQILDYQRFINNRIVKLGSSVWPFLIIISSLYLVYGVAFSWAKMGLNFVFLGYFGKIPGINHLWFLTVLMACYAELILLVKFKPQGRWFPWFFLGVMIGLMVLAELLGIPGLAFGYMGFFGFVFLRGRRLYEYSKSMNLYQAMIILAINAVCIWLCLNGLFEKSRIIYYLFTDICGLSLLVLLLRLLSDKSSKYVTFLSGISFEVYLVHLFFCAGPIIKIARWHYNHLLQFALIVVLSVVFAYILKTISKPLSKGLSKVLLESNKTA